MPQLPESHVEERSPLREMATVAAPAVIGMVSFSLMQFVDRLLCAKLINPEVLAAAGNGGIASWVPGAIMMGTLGVINTYVSQNLGAGKPERGAAYAWAGLWIGAAVWLVFLLPYAWLFPSVFAAMRDTLGLDAVSPHVHNMESDYGRIMLLGMIFTLTARSLGHYFYGMHKPKVVMFATIAGNIVNIGASVIFMLWAKSMGPVTDPDIARLALRGAAFGTLLGLMVEAAIPAILFLSRSYNDRFGTRAQWRPSFSHMRDILRIGWPGGIMFGNEMVCWWIFMGGFVASFDHGSAYTTHGTAGWITHQYLMLSFMPAVGISIATTAIVGKCIGAGRQDLVPKRTWLAVRLTMTYMGICALCFVLLGKQLVGFFISPEVPPEQAQEILRLARVMLLCAATFQLFDGLAITLSGALRGAGDTVWPGTATIVLSWTLIVGGGWLMVNYAPQLESFGPWIAASAYIVALSFMLLFRFRKGHWKNIKILSPLAGEGHEGGIPALASNPGGPAELSMAPGLDIPQPEPQPDPRPDPARN